MSQRSVLSRNAQPITKLKSANIFIEPRYKGASGERAKILIARIVEWYETDEGAVPSYGKCLLSPNVVKDPEKAKKIVIRYLEAVYEHIRFQVLLPDNRVAESHWFCNSESMSPGVRVIQN